MKLTRLFSMALAAMLVAACGEPTAVSVQGVRPAADVASMPDSTSASTASTTSTTSTEGGGDAARGGSMFGSGH